MRFRIHGAPRPGLLILLALLAAGAWKHLERRDATPSEGVWAVPGPVAHTASVPLLTLDALDPFGRSKGLVFALDEAQRVEIGVYDTAARLVYRVPASVFSTGRYRVTWDGRDTQGREVPPGLYVVRYDFGDTWSARRLVVLGGIP